MDTQSDEIGGAEECYYFITYSPTAFLQLGPSKKNTQRSTSSVLPKKYPHHHIAKTAWRLTCTAPVPCVLCACQSSIVHHMVLATTAGL